MPAAVSASSAKIPASDVYKRQQYSRDGEDELLNVPVLRDDQAEAYRFGSTHLILVRKIVLDQKLIGFVYLRADLNERAVRLSLIHIWR